MNITLKIKQLLCNHSFVVFPSEDIYLVPGDEYLNQKSLKYICECRKCKKQIEIIKRWTLIEQENK